jgi:methyl coenzyme M reductase subunit C-like uncharacterized protein (methanogenesis marker protein 7)
MPARKRPARRHAPVTKTADTKIVNNLTKEVRQITDENERETSTESIVNPASVMVAGKITRNLGDFNSAQVGVSIAMPCIADEERIERAYQRCTEWVEEKITLELGKV